MVISRCESLAHSNNFLKTLETGHVTLWNLISAFLLGEIKAMIFEAYLSFKGFLSIVFLVKMATKSCKGEMKNVPSFSSLRARNCRTLHIRQTLSGLKGVLLTFELAILATDS